MNSKRRQPPQGKGRGPRLERRNAAKNIDYEAMAAAAASIGASWSSSSSDESPIRATRSLDLSPSSYSNQTSFRIGGSVEGEVDLLCRSLGLSGPEEFAIPLTAWEARKGRSSSDLLPRSRLLDGYSPAPKDPTLAPNSAPADPSTAPREAPTSRPREEKEEEGRRPPDGSPAENRVTDDEPGKNSPRRLVAANGESGIRGVRPPILATPAAIVTLSPPPAALGPAPSVLAPPPSISLPLIDMAGSTWDIVRSFAPEDEDGGCGARGEERRKSFDSEDEGDLSGGAVEVVFRDLRLGETCEEFTGTSSLSTTNDDDASSTTTETMFIVSPNGRFKRNIKSWMRGMLLGSGSFGMVYEGISDEGGFFAVKEVSLLDQGNNAQQCILQLEQEIALLSQFEHENIVQYYGTDKEEAKLFIFLELVSQGSLASLYQKYHLRDTQVSAYTRQILSGLKYLHDRNVVHRDIKCANILVHANGSVKLADFGLAKEMTKINMLKSCKGSVYWMAPEVVHPKRTYGPPADIWSLGCTVLEMLTRQLPYPNLEWTQALFKIGRGEPPPIPNSLSRDACDFISRCVKVNPDDRPSASELLELPFVKRSLSAISGCDLSSRGNDRWS